MYSRYGASPYDRGTPSSVRTPPQSFGEYMARKATGAASASPATRPPLESASRAQGSLFAARSTPPPQPVAAQQENYQLPTTERSATADATTQIELLELRSTVRQLQSQLDRALADAEGLRHRLRESRQRADAREDELVREAERLRRTLEVERRRAQVPLDWHEFQRRQAMATQTSPAPPERSAAEDRIDAIVQAAEEQPQGVLRAAEGLPHSSQFFDEVAEVAFDEKLAPVLQDVLQAIVLREALRIKARSEGTGNGSAAALPRAILEASPTGTPARRRPASPVPAYRSTERIRSGDSGAAVKRPGLTSPVMSPSPPRDVAASVERVLDDDDDALFRGML